MRVVLTGAGGFVGRAVARRLAGPCDVIATDAHLGDRRGVEGDLCDPALLDRLFADGCDAVIHLATVPGGAAEQHPDRARAVNVDATMALIEASARAGQRPRFLFASSIAVFGAPLPSMVDDATPVAPLLLYGAHKAMMEQWIDAQTRRGAISGLSLRLPGIVARPRGPSGMKSAFMSDVFHHLAARAAIRLPVSPAATMWLMSVSRLADNIVRALDMPDTGCVNLPALRVTMADLVAAIGRATGAPMGLAEYAPDAELEAGFGRLPPLVTTRADAMGFVHDGDLDALVARVLATLS